MSEQWQELLIQDFCKITSGGTPTTSKQDYWDDGNVPWLSSGEVHKKRIRDVDGRITVLGLENSSAKLLPKDTILVALAGQGKTRGTVAITKIETTTNQSVAGIYPDNRVCDADFLFHNLDSRYLELRAESGGSGRAGLNLTILGEISVSIPPLPEQERIAAILTSVDEVIEKSQAQIDKLQDLKKATMNQLLTCGINHTEFKDSPLGKIPKDWEIKEFGDFVSEYRGGAALTPKDFSKTGFPVLPKKGVQFGGKFIFKGGIFCTYEFANKNKNNWVNSNFIISTLRDLVPSGPSIGLIVELDNNGDFILAQGVYGFSLNLGLNKSYISQLSNSDWFRLQMRKIFVGSTQVHIRTGEFLNLLIPVPPVEEQEHISSILKSFDTNIEEKHRKMEQTKALKKSLMQDLLTGKKRVRVN